MKCHAGFQKEAPECVAWTGSSFIESVLPVEENSNRHVYPVFYIGSIVLFILACLSHFPLDALGRRYPDSVFSSISKYGPAVLISTALLFMQTTVYLVKWIAVQKTKRRSGLLFEPDSKSFFVLIEDAMTYDRKKLSTEDAGLLFIDDQNLLLEMEQYRAHLKKTDVSVSLLHTSKNTAGVRLTVRHEHYPWTVVLSPVGNFGRFTEYSSLKKSRQLLEKLVDAGVRADDKACQSPVSNQPVLGDSFQSGMPHQPAEANFKETQPVEDDITERRYRDIIEIIEKEKKKKGWLKSAGILLVSLLFFFQLGFFRWGLEAVLLILLVLFIHEMGHFIGMKMFGYKNVKMFFIPLLGAAVSGQNHNAPAWKKAMVTLMGPLPGVLISLPLLITFIITDNQIYYKTGSMFLFLNLLNLLPVFPLDGGRFLHEVVFSRNRYIELVVNILTGGFLLIAGFGLKSWFLKVLGFFNLAGISMKFKLAAKSKQLKKELLENPVNAQYLESNDEEIPEHIMKHMINWIHSNISGVMNHKTVATTVRQMWERIRIAPVGVGATIGLLMIFLAGYIISFISTGVFAVLMVRNNPFTAKIVEYRTEAGSTGYKEQKRLGDGGKWEQQRWQDLPTELKEIYQEDAQIKQGPAGNQDSDNEP